MRHSSCLQVVCNPSCNRSAEGLRQGSRPLALTTPSRPPPASQIAAPTGRPSGFIPAQATPGPVSGSPSRPGSAVARPSGPPPPVLGHGPREPVPTGRAGGPVWVRRPAGSAGAECGPAATPSPRARARARARAADGCPG